MGYAERTSVDVDKTQAEIRKMLQKAGSTGFGMFEFSNQAEIQFELSDRRVKFVLDVTDMGEQPRRARWRARPRGRRR